MNPEFPPLPPDFAALLASLFDSLSPELRARIEESYVLPKPVFLWLNPLRGDPAATRKELAEEGLVLEPVSGFPETMPVYRLPHTDRPTLTHSRAAAEGRLYVQGLPSMAAVAALDPQPGESILDLAAAPGGKTALMAIGMRNTGQISAVEAVKPRYFRLKANLERLGVENTRCYLKDGAKVGRLVPARFDRVLLDAPCSSEARFSRLDAASWQHWSRKKVREAARKQERLLESALAALKPGGRLVYCTCALSPEENEGVLIGALMRHPTLVLESFALPSALTALPGLPVWKGARRPELARAQRFLPLPEHDAFFIAVIRKATSSA